jgi:hypothetical protein
MELKIIIIMGIMGIKRIMIIKITITITITITIKIRIRIKMVNEIKYSSNVLPI